MSLFWRKCRIIFCLFDKDSTQFPFYVQAAVMASFYITNMLRESGLYPRWKIRIYIEQDSFDKEQYFSAWKLIHKCDVAAIRYDFTMECFRLISEFVADEFHTKSGKHIVNSLLQTE